MNTPVIPDSGSIVLRATHCVEVRVERAAPSPWRPARPGYQAREVDLSLRVARALKGDLAERPGDLVEVRVSQEGYASARVMDALGGVWSDVALAPGASVLVFASSPSHGLAALVAEPACALVLPAEPFRDEVALALASEPLTLDALIARARALAPALQWVLAEHLWVRRGRGALTDAPTRAALFGLMLDPAVSPVARAKMLQMADDLAGAPDATGDYLDDLAVALFDLVALPAAAPLRDEVASTTLPNLLHLDERPRAPATIFARRPDAHTRARATLRAWTGAADVTALARWLR